MTKIGIVGCGIIAQQLLIASETGKLTVPIVGITNRTKENASRFLRTLKNPPKFFSRKELINEADLIVEAASGSIVPDLAKESFDFGKDLMIISVGALIENPQLVSLAKSKKCKIYAPSGAIAGLDGIKSASAGEIYSVSMITRKPLEALEGSPYLVERNMSVLKFKEEQEIFNGSAREACKGFPANINVSAAVSFAGIGPDKTKIKIIAVPGLKRNCHEIIVEGEFGNLKINIENIPTENPKTGRLTVMSIIKTIQGLNDSLQIGT
tara:strand:+ start:5700 stop:6500 length:801 start_codon:yes stop_codon:yes gene_type:complete